MDRDGVNLLLPETITTHFPRLQHIWLAAGDNGQGNGKDGIEQTLGWRAQIGAHPPRSRNGWAPPAIPPEHSDWAK